MKKKTSKWYGIRTISYDTSVLEAEVVRETPKRIWFSEDSGSFFHQASVNKSSKYELWYPTRENAVAAKLAMLKQDVKAHTEHKAEATTRLKEFKERENV